MAEPQSTEPQPPTAPLTEPKSTQPPLAEVHIVYTDQPQSQDPEAHHLNTLTSVIGSEEAAKGALLYTYKHAASGFSAKLTPDQAEQISNDRFLKRNAKCLEIDEEQPGVLQVVKSRTAELHSGPAQTHTM